MDYNELFTYNADTGDLVWRVRPIEHFSSEREHKRWNTRYALTVAGSRDTRGYVQVLVNRRPTRAHRIVWQMFNGILSDNIEIDHVNGIIDDNRIANLRKATHFENSQNKKRYASNKTGVKGVRLDRSSGMYLAQISANGTRIHLGSFTTKGTAAAARAKAALRLHGQFARFT